MLKISAFYLDKQKSCVPKKIYGMLVIETLKCKISDFLNSNTCFYLELYGSLHQGQTMRPTENFISLSMFKIPYIVTWL